MFPCDYQAILFVSKTQFAVSWWFFNRQTKYTDFFVINDSQYNNFTLQQFQNPKKSFSPLKSLSGFHFYQKDQQIVHHVWAFYIQLSCASFKVLSYFFGFTIAKEAQ